MHLVEQIKAKAKKNLQTVVLPESYDERMLFAAQQVAEQGLAKIVILGNPAEVKATAAAKGVNLTGVEIIDPANSPKLDAYVAAFVELRKSKGMTPEEARKLLTAKDNLYYAGMMVRQGDAGGEVAGATSTTGNVLKAAFQTVGTAPGIKTVSSYFFMVTKTPTFGENGILLFADCAVNPNPDAQALAEIAVATARNCKAFLDVEARVAMLSFSTKGSASHSDVDKVLKAMEIAKGIDPNIQVDGELQADAALLPIENSLEGSVGTTLDLLVHHPGPLIRREVLLPVRENLLAAPGTRLEDVRRVLSHPQPFGQDLRLLDTGFGHENDELIASPA